MINVKVAGHLCVATGDNWQYKRVGHLKVFNQSGKVASIRTIKTMIKLIIKENNND